MSSARIQAFPQRLSGPLCWDRNTFCKRIFELTELDIASILLAVAHFHQLAVPIACVSPETFPLRRCLAQRLRGISQEVHRGQGFAILRGLNPDDFSDEENVLIFCGLSSYVGVTRSSDAKGVAMTHIRDARKDRIVLDNRNPNVCLSAAKLPEAMKFHADGRYGDVIAMYVRSTGSAGGTQYLASFWTVYNQLKRYDPKVLEVLAEDIDFPGETSPAYEYEESRRPFIFQSAGRVLCQMTWNPFKNSDKLTEDQRRAMLRVNDMSRQVGVAIEHQPGDLQFVNNFALLHARDSYRDTHESFRHIMRLGLRDPELAWSVPRSWEPYFDNHYRCPPELQAIPVTDMYPWHHGKYSRAPDHG